VHKTAAVVWHRACSFSLPPKVGPLNWAEEVRHDVDSNTPTNQPPDPVIGSLVGRYRVVRKIAQGGMGAVYEALDTDNQQRAAIKVLLPELSSRPEAVNRFFLEAKATGMVQHPSLVRILEHGKTDLGEAFIAMEYLDGRSLRQAQDEAYLGTSATEIVSQMASALAAAHAKRIIHRDLKPENVILVQDLDATCGKRAKILDFGIAKLLPDEGTRPDGNAATRTGTLLGTPMYMSPEQCRASSPPDEKTDVYSIGIILYELLYGEPPFVSDSAGELFALQMFGTPPRLKDRVPHVVESLDALVHRLLDKQPANRPSMAELVDALTTIPQTGLSDGSISERPCLGYTNQQRKVTEPVGLLESQLTTGNRASKRGELIQTGSAQRERTTPSLLLIMLAVLVVLAGFFFAQKKSQPPLPSPQTTTNPSEKPFPLVLPDLSQSVIEPEHLDVKNDSHKVPSGGTIDHKKTSGKGPKPGKGGRRRDSEATTDGKVQVDLWK